MTAIESIEKRIARIKGEQGMLIGLLSKGYTDLLNKTPSHSVEVLRVHAHEVAMLDVRIQAFEAALRDIKSS